jgi:hypothetical protein
MSQPGNTRPLTRRTRHGAAYLVLAALALLPRPAGSAPAGSITWLFPTPASNVDLELRLTSVASGGSGRIARADLQHRRRDDGARLNVAIETAGQSRQAFCLQCGPTGIIRACAGEGAAFPRSREERIPGTLLPWEVLTLGFCRTYRARQVEPRQESVGRAVELVPSPPEAGAAGFTLRVSLSGPDDLPTAVVSLDAQGRARWTLDILEVRKTAWGPAVTRSMFRSPDRGDRVLIEIRAGRFSGSDDDHRGPGQPDSR